MDDDHRKWKRVNKLQPRRKAFKGGSRSVTLAEHKRKQKATLDDFRRHAQAAKNGTGHWSDVQERAVE